jgi:hypothetical protein
LLEIGWFIFRWEEEKCPCVTVETCPVLYVVRVMTHLAGTLILITLSCRD